MEETTIKKGQKEALFGQKIQPCPFQWRLLTMGRVFRRERESGENKLSGGKSCPAHESTSEQR